jgi:hypothetical protein
MKRLKRFSDFVAERESAELQAEMKSFQDFAVADGWLKNEHTSVNTSPKLASELIKRNRSKKKRKAIIPIDSITSGEFPQRIEDYEARLHHCIMLLEHINEMERPFVVATARRIMAAIRSSNSTISELAKLCGAERYRE